MSSTPSGITPPAPNLEREEPDFWIEDDIPSDDGERRPAARSERGSPAAREERPHKPERE
jgi:hypothetical protein